MEEGVSDALLGHLRNELRKEKIKLWEEPYTVDGGGTEHLVSLASSMSIKLKLPKPQVFGALEQLRHHALERQQQNNKFKFNKVATLKLKFSSKTIHQKISVIETKLDASGGQLMESIAEKLAIPADHLKLVYSGKIIHKELNLAEQGIQHNRTIMCLYFPPDTKQQAAQIEKEMQEVRKARRGAELLATSNAASVGNLDAQITDQNGRTIDLPEEERVSLMIALGLHEKGKAVLKTEKYSFALLFLLEAESEFSQCRADILNQVDNFAVLHLDISWCYLQLENLEALPDASKRLQVCESFFKRSYGESLQRLRAIKGSAGLEVALYVRLYVLQGVVAYYEGKYTLARDLLSKAQFYASSIQVDGDKVVEMMNVGFSSAEARLALRTCDGDLMAATRHAFTKREDKERIMNEEKEKSRKRKLARSLGPCDSGEELNIDVYERMVNELGYDRTIAAEALKKRNNDLFDAMQLIHENPESLRSRKSVVNSDLVQKVIYFTHIYFTQVSEQTGLNFLLLRRAV